MFFAPHIRVKTLVTGKGDESSILSATFAPRECPLFPGSFYLNPAELLQK